MSNDFTEDSRCAALWRFEPGALLPDSIGGNTLSQMGDEGHDATSETGAGEYREGSGSVKTIYDSEGWMGYLGILDANLDAGFPLKNGDAAKLISLAGWIRPVVDYSGTYTYWFEKYHPTDSTKRTIQFGWRSSTGELALRVFYSGGSQLISTSGAGLQLDQWYHAGLALDGINKTYLIRLYDLEANSAQTFSGSFTNGLLVAAGPVNIGRFVDAYLDEFVVFDELLTADEFDQIRSGTFGPASGLNFLDGKAEIIYPAAIDLLDGKARVRFGPESLLDGKVFLFGSLSNLLDGRLSVVTEMMRRWRKRIFKMILRSDGLEDVEVPVSTITLRLRNTKGSYISVTVPDPTAYTQQIIDRIAGTMRILAGYVMDDGSLDVREIIYANTQNIYFGTGTGNLLTLAGTRYITHENPRNVSLAGIINMARAAQDRYRARCGLDLTVKPTDAIAAWGESFTADLINVVITAKDAYMDVEGE